MTQHPALAVRAVVDVLADRVDDLVRWLNHGADDALDVVAGEILDTTDLAAWRDRAQRAEAALALRHNLDRLGDVVDLVAAVLERRMMLWDDARDTATEIACILFGDAYAIRNDDGTATMHWPDDQARAALVTRELLELLVADANRVRAGSEPYPAEAVELTAGQWWGMLLDLDPDARRKAIDDVRDAAIAGGACRMFRHEERITSDSARLRELEPEVDTLRRTLAALRGPLAPLVDRTPTPAPETPTAVLTLPNGLCTGRTNCPSTVHVRGCYRDPAATPSQQEVSP